MMTNKEIKKMCIKQQLKQGGKDYPKWKFKVTQNKEIIKIYWEYLDGKYWIINNNTLMVFDEHKHFMNESLEYDGSLPDIIESMVYYMVTRY